MLPFVGFFQVEVLTCNPKIVLVVMEVEEDSMIQLF